MTTLKTRLLQAAVLTVVALTLGTSAHAQEEARVRQANGARRSSNFIVSGTYGGVLGTQVLISGVAYQLGEGTQVFQLGVGLVPVGDVPIGSLMFASGTGTVEAGTVLGLIARPAGDASSVNSVSPNIREMPASSPK